MYANAYEMKMPTNYVDMNARELEYGGGWNWKKILTTVAVVVAVTAVYCVVPIAAVYVGCAMAVSTSATVSAAGGLVLEATASGAIAGGLATFAARTITKP